MQGGLMGKPCMSCVRHLSSFFTQTVYAAVQPLLNCGRKFNEIRATRYGFFDIQILPTFGRGPVPAGGAYSAPRLGRGTPSLRLRRIVPRFKTFRRPCL